MRRKIVHEAVYPHAPELVWRALTDSDLLAHWLMPNDFEPRVGHQFTFRTEPAPGFDGIVHCEVRELDAPRRLVFTWRGGPVDTVVAFDLEPVDTGTLLRFEQDGFDTIKSVLVSFILGAGFRKMYRRLLPDLLARLEAGEDVAPARGCDRRIQPASVDRRNWEKTG